MATYIERARQLIQAGIDGTPTAEQEQRVADAFVEYASDIAESVFADPANPTNTEKAEVFVKAFRRWGRSVLRATAETQARADNDATVAAAGDSAEADL